MSETQKPAGSQNTSSQPGETFGPGVIPTDWPIQATDKIVQTIATVRDKTTRPVLVLARGLVYGLLAGIVGIVAITLLFVFIVRLYDVYMPGPIWPFYLALSIVLSVLGLVLLRKANQPVQEQ